MPLEKLEATWRDMLSQLESAITAVTDSDGLRRLTGSIGELPDTEASLLTLFVRMPIEAVTARVQVRRYRHHFTEAADFVAFRTAYLRLSHMRTQIAFYTRLRRFMGSWRVFHVVLSIFLVVIISMHIALSLYLGYGWILF